MQNTPPKTTHTVKIDTGRIKLPVLAPLFVAILALLATFTLAIYNLQQRHITNDIRMRLNSTSRSFNQHLALDARLLEATIHFIKNDPTIQNAWLAKDRNKLLSYTTPLFEKFRNEYKVTHIYFIDTNNTCFLRVHSPPRYGDHIDRYTLRVASHDQKPFWGIELGLYGTFTLRTVHPWVINNDLAGYIELGEEIEHITPQIKEALDVDIVILIDKSLLKRQTWEEGQKIMGRTGNWELMPNRVIANSTISSIPPEFIKFAGLHRGEHKNLVFAAKFNGSRYRAGFVRLPDAAGREVGDILVIKNVSENEASLHILLAVVAMLCFFIAVLLVSFFYIHITNIEKRLIQARNSLETEIEKRKQAESELRKHRDHLKEIVKSRTAELEETNKHLQGEIVERKKAEEKQAQLLKELENANRELKDLVYISSHDLKTPLRGIKTLAEWLSADYADKLGEQGREQIGLLLIRVERMYNLIEGILQYSRIGRVKENIAVINLNKLITEIISTLAPPANISVTVENELPTIKSEPTRIAQVFQNLMSNAIKYMDKPQGQIKVGCVEEDEFWKFGVTDNGPGIEERYFEKIFQIFQTLAPRDDFESTGIGLTVVKKIVELYGGRVWVESKPGEGSTFFFTLPKQETRPGEVPGRSQMGVKNAKLKTNIACRR